MRGAVERVPELDGDPVAVAKGNLEAFNFGVAIGVARIELAPGADAAAKAEGQVVDLAEGAAGLIGGRYRSLECLRSHDAVRFKFRISGGVVLAISVELPVFASQPSQHA